MSKPVYQWVASEKVTRRHKILQAICEEFECTEREVKSRRKVQHLVDARTVYCYIMRIKLFETFKRIAIDIRRDHTVVMWNVRRMEDIILNKDWLYQKYKRIIKELFTKQII